MQDDPVAVDFPTEGPEAGDEPHDLPPLPLLLGAAVTAATATAEAVIDVWRMIFLFDESYTTCGSVRHRRKPRITGGTVTAEDC